MGKIFLPNYDNMRNYFQIKRRQQRSTSSLFTPLQIQDGIHLSNTSNSYNIQHVSRHRLRIMDKLGEGSFGLVGTKIY